MDAKISGAQRSYHTPVNEEKVVPPSAPGEMRIGSDNRAVPVAIARGVVSSATAMNQLGLIEHAPGNRPFRPLLQEEVKKIFDGNTSATSYVDDACTWRNVGGDSAEDDFFEPAAFTLGENSNRLTHRPIAEL